MWWLLPACLDHTADFRQGVCKGIGNRTPLGVEPLFSLHAKREANYCVNSKTHASVFANGVPALSAKYPAVTTNTAGP
jgi:hypothetical protein